MRLPRAAEPSTGLPGLDRALNGILPGDSIVWQVASVDHYRAFVRPFSEAARAAGRTVTYFRFASHPPLLGPDEVSSIRELDPAGGFENFITTIHETAREAGRGAVYVFDCLSDLAINWYSDQMLGNFFMLTCPYLYDLETLAYFALFRAQHSSRATKPILSTTQLFLDVYHHRDRFYVRPLKVLHRFSSTMLMLHEWRGREFRPIAASTEIAEVLTASEWGGLSADAQPTWRERVFSETQQLIERDEAGTLDAEEKREQIMRLGRMIISRDEEILELVAAHLSLQDILHIRRRMIGTGLIGGKAVGMLVARAILEKSDARFGPLLEPHDSFYIGSDVFYGFLVANGVWWARQKQMSPDTFLEAAQGARSRILTGEFPDYIIERFRDMLDYFGQSPFIVRSSSLLEDNFANSFAGKYESVFCANQGHQERRLDDFLAAVRTVYASTMSEKALRYRARRGLLKFDEQMALLVMRVSGARHGRFFYPAVAGVGFSFNPYAWSDHIDPQAGVIRLVFGLGTRAVDRADDDYTRVVALNAPTRRPEANFDEVSQYAQRRADALDLDSNQLMSHYFMDLIRDAKDLPVEMLASPDRQPNVRREDQPWVLTFNELLTETDFVEQMRAMLAALERAYGCPVDVEFTANFVDDQTYKINPVQCRPLQVRGTEQTAPPEIDVDPDSRIIEAQGHVIGHSRVVDIERIIYVVPFTYGVLRLQERYGVARLIGQINRSLAGDGVKNVMLVGPGRWGTSTPELGVPVAFHDINHVSVVCEIVVMRDDLIPDVSLGTHFFSELVEADVLYLALVPRHSGSWMNEAFFANADNRLSDYVPDAEQWKHVVKIIDAPPGSPRMRLLANARQRRVVCYFDND
jgi:pyruvate,water dikinase